MMVVVRQPEQSQNKARIEPEWTAGVGTYKYRTCYVGKADQEARYGYVGKRGQSTWPHTWYRLFLRATNEIDSRAVGAYVLE